MSVPLTLAVNVDLTADAGTLRDYLKDVEAAGADMVWVPEAYGRDAASVLGFCAAATTRMRLGSAVLNVYSRTPALLAQTAAACDELSRGRFDLGLGTSGPQVVEGWHGLPFDRPLTRTREVVDICRRIWRREVNVHQGTAFSVPYDAGKGTGQGKPLKLMTYPVRSRIPVWLAGLGPRNVRLTAEIAEGWLPSLFIPELADRVWGEDLRQGAQRRDPLLPPLEIAVGAHVEVTSEDHGAIRTARDRARPSLARYIGGMGAVGANFYNDLIRRYGFGQEAEQVQRLYLDRRPEAAAAALSDELVQALTVCGPPSYVKDRFAAFRSAGVTNFRVNVNAGSDGPRAVERLKELTR
ncbi:LLM class F420-dependent oxidoreductase [Streptomyces sp. CBMA29]|uniref:LLM class F420-dependent oxidoreductase n=1 Tax=Streptomyces sp. CBMA29 TaxID=1896314 RepID=UPI001661AFDC|nr:LLM class F420-dependent oxidoreductase [Streptomyces sp. CBMA29]MBD0736701.1 LLM class F420-dependent oxidoreductase [Streptomyces sp. CBMA29]